MTIRFAAASGIHNAPACAPIARGLVRRARERAVNDNDDRHDRNDRNDGTGNGSAAARPARMRAPAPSADILRAALRHFAEHGLGAARAARGRAEAAFFAGDRAAYDWWLEVTRTLDRRLAAEIDPGNTPLATRPPPGATRPGA